MPKFYKSATTISLPNLILEPNSPNHSRPSAINLLKIKRISICVDRVFRRQNADRSLKIKPLACGL